MAMIRCLGVHRSPRTLPRATLSTRPSQVGITCGSPYVPCRSFLHHVLGGGPPSNKTQRFKEKVVLPYVYTLSNSYSYTSEQLYSIVADVDSYKEFLPYCLESRVLGPAGPQAQRNNPEATYLVDAELVIGFSALRESYVSEVSMRPHEWVKAKAKPSPLFQGLETAWHFRPLAACHQARTPQTEVTFTLAFAFSSPMYAAIAGQVFEKLSSRMIHAFQTRSQALYG